LLFIFKSQEPYTRTLKVSNNVDLTPKAPIFRQCQRPYWDSLGFKSSLNIHETETFEITNTDNIQINSKFPQTLNALWI